MAGLFSPLVADAKPTNGIALPVPALFYDYMDYHQDNHKFAFAVSICMVAGIDLRALGAKNM